MRRIYLLLVLLALALRLILIPNPGFEADISFWKSWGLAVVDHGVIEGIALTNNNYPTPFVYPLGAMVWIYKLFADPHNFGEFWSNTNLLFLTISKLFPIAADLGIAALIVYIGKNAKRFGFPVISFSLFGLPFYELLSLVYLFSPLGLIDGAWWGQVDSVGVFLFLLSVLCALSRRPFVAGLVFMIAMMTKLQNMIYAPLFFLFLWQTTGFTGLIWGVVGAFTGFFGLNIEFLLSRNMDRVLASLTENYDYFPWMSLMAYNLWWIVSGARGMATSDKLTILGMVNAKTIGLILFSGFYLFASLRQLLNKKQILQTFIESLIISNAAFFLFQTQSHDRYAFPLAVFLLLWAPFYVNHESGILNTGKKRRLILFSILYAVFTMLYFYNLHTALAVNYPQNGLSILTAFVQPMTTIATAYVLIGLFGVFLFSLLRASQTTRYLLVGVSALCITILLILNAPLRTHTPVSLTAFTPYISQQAYGTRQTNRSVQSFTGGAYKWTRLSVQYLFYDKGVGTHANSKHVYHLNKQFKRFTTDFGIDTEAGSKASAIFEIWGDDKLLFRSEKMGRFDLPKHADVQITGVTYLSLITTDAGDGNFDDHTDWLNPTLWP